MEDRRVKVWVQRFPDRPTLVLQWIDPDTGKRKSKSAGTADEAQAENKRADFESDLNNNRYQESSRMTWERFRELYEEEKLDGRREATRKKAGYVFDRFEELARPRTLGAVNERTLSKYAAALREAGCKAATIQGHLAYLRAALRWAADQKIIGTAPKVSMPKVPKKKIIRKIVAEEFERLLAVAPNDDWNALMRIAWHTGLRRTEMLDLTWDGDGDTPWVDFAHSRIFLPAGYNKADVDQWVPIHPELSIPLKEHRDRRGGERARGKVLRLSPSPREVSRTFTELARQAGLKISLHDLRRSFGSRYAAVVPAAVLQRLMRHADIKTTLTYYTDVDGVLDEAILKA
jgi:integrase